MNGIYSYNTGYPLHFLNCDLGFKKIAKNNEKIFKRNVSHINSHAHSHGISYETPLS